MWLTKILNTADHTGSSSLHDLRGRNFRWVKRLEYGLHWAVPAFESLMPEHPKRTKSIEVDLHRPTGDPDRFPFVSGKTGEFIGEIKVRQVLPSSSRQDPCAVTKRSRCPLGKMVKDVAYSSSHSKVTVGLTDGTDSTEDSGSLIVRGRYL